MSNLSGAWYGKAYSGEGFGIHENEGKILLYWYTFSPNGDGEQQWLMGIGYREEGSPIILLDVVRPIGGKFVSAENPEKVVNEPWGTISLKENPDGTLDMFFNKLSGSAGAYRLTKLFGADAVTPVPEPQNVIVVERKLHFGWEEIQFDSHGQISGFIPRKQQEFNPRKKQDDWRLTVTKGEINISKIAYDGVGNPAIVGLKKGDRITDNDPPREFSTHAGPLSINRWELINYFIESEEHGLFFNTGYQVNVG